MDSYLGVMILGGLLIGSVAGFVMHRSDFCVAGMFRDLFLFRASSRLKCLLLLVAVSMLLFEGIRLSGWVPVPYPFFGPPSFVNVFGGLLFGVGMVLAGGCVVGTLYKMGSGSLASFLTFLGLILGSTLYALLYPVCVVWLKPLVLPTDAVTIPQLLGVTPWVVVLPCSILIGGMIYRWWKQGQLQEAMVVEEYLQPMKAAFLLALLGAASVVLVGMPMGITTSYTKFGAFLVQAVAPEWYASIAYFKLMPLKYVPPFGAKLITGGTGAQVDAVSLVQFPLIIGIVAGAAVSAFRLGEWQFRWRLPWRQLISAIAGGVIMGVASRLAPACNIWHLFGGLPILALQSILFVVGLIPGAWIGGLILTRYVMK